MQIPTVSIITISYNNINGLIQTTNSVKQQSGDFEHIIVDGNSNDGTHSFLNGLNYPNLTIKSEPDNGIYDAMNKGIKMATGKWIIFMNAGDTFHSNKVIDDFLTQNFKRDLIYGNCQIKYSNGLIRLAKPKNISSLWKGMSFSHQTVFVKKELLQQHLFDLSYQFCADFNFIYNLFLKRYSFNYWDYTIANIEAGGVSDQKRYLSTLEVYRINQKLLPQLKNHLYFIPKIAIGFTVVKIKSILPEKTIKSLTKLKYK